jgi:hypothetical protein
MAGGGGDLPPEAEVFKSESYSNFIYLFFKIGTEVNVFSHLGKVLFTQMKERNQHIAALFFFYTQSEIFRNICLPKVLRKGFFTIGRLRTILRFFAKSSQKF